MDTKYLYQLPRIKAAEKKRWLAETPQTGDTTTIKDADFVVRV